MLFHLVYVQMAGSFLPALIKTGAQIGFGAKAAAKAMNAPVVDCNVIFTAEELDKFRKSSDAEEVRRLHKAAAERGEKNEADSFCSHCGHAKTSLLFHCFNSQMFLSEEEWREMDDTADAARYRLLISLGRRNARDFRGLYRDSILGFDMCPVCGASRSAKTHKNTA